MDDALRPTDGVTPDMTAAELALGLLEGSERAEALRRVLAEPAFAQEVETWRLYFAQLFDLWPEADAPEGLIERIDAGLGSPVRARRTRLPWPAIAVMASAAAAALLIILLARPLLPPGPAPDRGPPDRIAATPQPQSGPLLVATLGDPKSPIAAAYDAAAGALRIASAPVQPSTKVAELWIIGGDGVPHPLGLLAAKQTTLTLPIPDRARVGAGATLAISVEPPGGSPKVTPTGPVIATGVLTAV